MKKYTIEISAPKNEELDKVRVFVGRVDTGEEVFAAEHLVYEGALVEEFSFNEYKSGLNFYAVEYFNDEGTVERGRFAKPIYLLEDAIHWDYIADEMRYSTMDDRAAVFRPLGKEIPELAPWMYKFFNKTWATISGIPTNVNNTSYQNQYQAVEAPVFVDRKGNIRSFMVPLVDVSMTLAHRRRIVHSVKTMPKSMRRFTVDGLVWEFDILDTETAFIVAEILLYSRITTANQWGRFVTTNAMISPTTISYVANAYLTFDPEQESSLQGIPENPTDAQLTQLKFNVISGYEPATNTPRLLRNTTESSGTTSMVFGLRMIGREGEVIDGEEEEVSVEAEA